MYDISASFSGRFHHSKFESILFAPFLHDLHEILYLWIVSVLEHLNDLNKSFPLLFAGNNHLEDANCSTSLAFPEFGVWIKSFQDIECFDGIVELTHLIAIIGNQIKQLE